LLIMAYSDLEPGVDAARERAVVLGREGPSRRMLDFACLPVVIASVAFLLRLGNIVGNRTYAGSNTWTFGYETGVIAYWLATGHGFSSPYLTSPQPTAILPPVNPLLLAGVFKVFGVFTNASKFAMLALGALFSALICMTLFAIGKRMFGRAVAVLAGWAWALLPNAIYWSTHWISEINLFTLMLSLGFLLTLRLDRNERLWKAFALGLFWALGLLINPAIGSFVVVSIGWLAYQLRHSYRKALALSAITCLGVALGMVPWVARNYRVFGEVVLLRSGFPQELWDGNHPGGTGLPWKIFPWNPDRLRQLGELGYMAELRHEAIQFILHNPCTFAVFSLRRIGYFWCNIPVRAPRHALYFDFALLAFYGLGVAYRKKVKGMSLFAGLFLFFPLVYYITHCELRYQFPIMPEMLLLAVYALHASYRQPSKVASWLLAIRNLTNPASSVRS
jgi:4-amino-4-deoxy-L-arabinose transferase-like glycosyltransferase